MFYTYKILAINVLLFLSTYSFSQNGYLKLTIVNGDTTTKYSPDQVYWILKQDFTDYIIESKLNSRGVRSDSKHPVVGRLYEGYIKEYIVSGMNIDDFTIRFHAGDHTVTYIYQNKTIVYKGKNITFKL